MSEAIETDISESGVGKKRIAIIAIIVAAVAVACILLLWLLPAKETPTFVIWHSYPEGSPQAEYIEKTVLPSLESRYMMWLV